MFHLCSAQYSAMLIHGCGLYIAQMQNKANKGSRKQKVLLFLLFPPRPPFMKQIICWGVHAHTQESVLKDISLQKQESSVSAGGSGSKALLFIVASSLEMGIYSLTNHHVLNSTACKIYLV